MKVIDLQHHISKTTLLLKEWGTVQETLAVQQDSQNSLLQENEVWMASFAGKLQLMKTNMEEAAFNSTNDDSVKFLMDLGIAATELISKLGLLQIAIAGVVFVGLNKSFKDSGGILQGVISRVKEYIATQKEATTSSKTLATVTTSTGTSLKVLGATTSTTGTQATISGTKFGLLKAALNTTSIAANIASVAMKALGFAVNLAIGFGVSFAIQKIIELADALITTKEELRELNAEMYQDIQNSGKSITDTEKLIQKQSELQEELGKTDDIAKQRELQEQLLEIQRGIATALPESVSGWDENGVAISANNKLIKEQIELAKINMVIKAQEFAENNKNVIADIENYDKKKKAYQDLMLAQKKGEKINKDLVNVDKYTGNKSTNTYSSKVDTEMLKKQKEEMDDTIKTMQQYQSIASKMKLSGIADSDIKNALGFTKEELDRYIESALGATNSNNDLKSSMDDVAKSSSELAKEVEALGGEFDKTSSKINLINTMMKEYKETGGFTEGTWSKLMKEENQDLLAMTQNTDTMMGKLNESLGKLEQDRLKIRDEALRKAIEMDNRDVESKVDAENKKIDVANKSSEEIVKSQNGVLDSNTNAYQSDVDKFTEAQNKKIDVAYQAAQRIAKTLASAIGVDEESYAQLIYDKMERLGISLGSGVTHPGTITAPTIIKPPPISSSTSSGDKGQTKKDVADLELKIDRYQLLNDRLDDVNDALELNRVLQQSANGDDYNNLLKEEIALLEKKKQAIANIIAEKQKEAGELKNQLSNNGFKFDADGNVANSVARLNELQNWANSQTGAEKEKAIKQVNKLKEALDRYISVTQNDLPNSNKEWQNMTNEIKKAYEEQAKFIADQEKKAYEVAEYYARKKTDAIKNEIEKQRKLLSNQWKEEDEADSRKKAEDELVGLKERIALAVRSGDKELEASLRKQYSDVQESLNQMIRDQERDNINNKFDEEIENADKKLEDFLKPENINKVIQDALANGVMNVMGETIKLQDGMTNMLKETTIGWQSANMQITDYIKSLEKANSLYGNLANINIGAGIGAFANMPKMGSYGVGNGESRSVSLNINAPIIGNIEGGTDANEVGIIVRKELDNFAKELNEKY